MDVFLLILHVYWTAQHRGPPEFTMVPENRTVYVENEAELNCKFLSGDPAYVQWIKHDLPNMDTNGTLRFKVVKVGSGQCFKHNS